MIVFVVYVVVVFKGGFGMDVTDNVTSVVVFFFPQRAM